jgi:hypothetical protein
MNGEIPTSPAWAFESSGGNGHPVTATLDLQDEIVSHIYRAALLIDTYGRRVGCASEPELENANDELDTAIHKLQRAALEGNSGVAFAERPSLFVARSQDSNR